jgi:hypothetical protein
MAFPRLAAFVAALALTSVPAGFGLATPQRAEAAAPPKVDPVIGNVAHYVLRHDLLLR